MFQPKTKFFSYLKISLPAPVPGPMPLPIYAASSPIPTPRTRSPRRGADLPMASTAPNTLDLGAGAVHQEAAHRRGELVIVEHGGTVTV